PERARGVGLLDVSNRGSKAALWYFNDGASAADPGLEEHFGDGYLMQLGLTVIWVGWQWDVVPGEGVLHLEAPVARAPDGSPIRGLVRSDWTVDEAVSFMPLGHRGPASYEVADPEDPENVLTVRDGRDAPREVVPRDQWRFAREEEGEVIPDPGHIYTEGGFQAGRIYELVYVAQDPVVGGIGLAAIRDVISYAKYDEEALFPVRKGVAFGVSQTGRLLRHYLHEGFNTDEAGRQALDGVLIHTGGAGRGSFNHRFAQPSRDAHRYSAFFYPTDLFPFTTRAQRDPLTGAEGGLVGPPGNQEDLPLIMQSNSGYEYWGRAASLIHTSVDGRMDVDPLPGERIYHHASAQHFVRPFPGDDFTRIGEGERYRGNPVDFLVTLRALLTRLVEWVDEGREPPPTRTPRLDEGTLVPIHRVGFPDIPGVTFPEVIHVAYRADYGPRWDEGIVDQQPPELGEPFPSLVARVDGLGN
ncbi:MAG: alpha/beta hydrolase domain-containing protein, partial [Gemmatimonadota bacterium]